MKEKEFLEHCIGAGKCLVAVLLGYVAIEYVRFQDTPVELRQQDAPYVSLKKEEWKFGGVNVFYDHDGDGKPDEQLFQKQNQLLMSLRHWTQSLMLAEGMTTMLPIMSNQSNSDGLLHARTNKKLVTF
jgi:hypothetical protein